MITVKITVSCLLTMLVILINVSCANNSNKPDAQFPLSADTIKRPPGISESATLLNFGSEDEKIYVWADPIGPLISNGKTYSHILSVKFYYVTAKKTMFLYYENFRLRNVNKSFDFKRSKILNYPGDATLQLTNNEDTLLVYHVLETREFEREYEGIHFKDMPTVERNSSNEYIADARLEFNLTRDNAGAYMLTLTDGPKIAYKLCAECNEQPELVSFLNREDGRIYFINRKCYLELVNKNDVQRFQGLR